jgi:hypothetical protein
VHMHVVDYIYERRFSYADVVVASAALVRALRGAWSPLLLRQMHKPRSKHARSRW